ncbi:MAG: hypothetical protein EPO61_09545 [Nitrospirae bacterium]|nr:MAG: hypothetical protein EPO61_09545 [Nitrospirota bacterium]
MKSVFHIKQSVFVASLVLILGSVAWPTQAAEPLSGLGLVASGAVEDTLPACLARIPKDASAGQRMFAEESCKRDEAARASFQAVPGR